VANSTDAPPPARRRGQTLTLAEAHRLALANNRDIQVVRYVQEERFTEIDRLLGDFETVLGAGLLGGYSYRQARNIVESFGSVTNQQKSYLFRQRDDNQFYVEQRLEHGGLCRFGFTTDYLELDPADFGTFVNPGWGSALQFHYEKPIFQQRGPEVNLAPVEVAQAKAEQSVHEFQALVNATLRDAEIAYWDLELAQYTTEVLGEFESHAKQTLEREQGRLELGRGTIPAVARSKERYARARAQRERAEGLATLAEFRLRRLLGLPVFSQQPLKVVAPSGDDQANIDLHAGLVRAQQRPELHAQLAAIQAARTDAFYQSDGLKPDLAMVFDYEVTGLEESFAGSLDTLAEFGFNTWRMGLLYRRPIRQVTQKALVRKAEAVLRKEIATLDKVSLEIENELASAFEAVRVARVEVETQRIRGKAADEDRKARAELYEQGRETIDQVLDADDRYVEAALDEHRALADLQKALTQWRFACGAIMDDYVVVQ
jgi:outer membrane protein TolC